MAHGQNETRRNHSPVSRQNGYQAAVRRYCLSALQRNPKPVATEYEDRLAVERTKAQEKAQQKVAVELKDRDQQIKELSEQVQATQEKELQLLKQQREIKQQQQKLEQDKEQIRQQMQAEFEEQKQKVAADAVQKAKDQLAVEMKDRDEQIKEMESQLKTAREQRNKLMHKGELLDPIESGQFQSAVRDLWVFLIDPPFELNSGWSYRTWKIKD